MRNWRSLDVLAVSMGILLKKRLRAEYICGLTETCSDVACVLKCELPYGFYADNQDCTGYCLCTGDSSLPSQYVHCQGGTVYDPIHKICNWEYNVDLSHCSTPNTTEALTTTATPTTTTQPPLAPQPTIQIDGPVLTDGTIRAISSSSCITKRPKKPRDFYEDGHELRHTTCETHIPRFFWTYDATLKQIISVGSQRYNPTEPYCWSISIPEQRHPQRVKLARCDPDAIAQQFDYAHGRLISRANSELCVGFDSRRTDSPVTASLCIHNTFFAISSASMTAGPHQNLLTHGPTQVDNSIRPLGYEMCIFKRYSGWKKDQTIWLWPCFQNLSPVSVFADRVQRARKNRSRKLFKQMWRHDESSGQIHSLHDSPFCLYVTDVKTKGQRKQEKERLKIIACDVDDNRQRWDYERTGASGEATGIFRLRENTDLCLGMQVSSLQKSSDFKVPLVVTWCYPNLFGLVTLL